MPPCCRFLPLGLNRRTEEGYLSMNWKRAWRRFSSPRLTNGWGRCPESQLIGRIDRYQDEEARNCRWAETPRWSRDQDLGPRGRPQYLSKGVLQPWQIPHPKGDQTIEEILVTKNLSRSPIHSLEYGGTKPKTVFIYHQRRKQMYRADRAASLWGGVYYTRLDSLNVSWLSSNSSLFRTDSRDISGVSHISVRLQFVTHLNYALLHILDCHVQGCI